MPKSPFEVLQLQSGASKAEIQEQYRKLARQVHPDLCSNGNKAASEQAFKELSEAYTQLTVKGYTGWQGHRQQTFYASAKRPVRFSNGAVAAIIVMPLIFTGAYLGQRYPRFAQEANRPHGMLQQPQNVFWLKDEALPRQRSRW